MSRGPRIALALVAVQVALLGVFAWVERSRAPDPPFRSEVLDLPAPAVDGVDLSRGRVVVHFWATWCAPCVTELPSLLAAADEEGVRLLAATEEPWPVVERYFAGEVPAAIAPDADGAARVAFGVSGLPDTFVVQDGRIVGRVGGPRDWATPAARRFLTGGP